MLVAYHTGTPPAQVREDWSWNDMMEFLACVPLARRLGHPLFGGEE